MILDSRIFSYKPTFRDERKAYIKAKYEEKHFVRSFCPTYEEFLPKIDSSIRNHNLHDLLQVFGEAHLHKVDLNDSLPGNVRIN